MYIKTDSELVRNFIVEELFKIAMVSKYKKVEKKRKVVMNMLFDRVLYSTPLNTCIYLTMTVIFV